MDERLQPGRRATQQPRRWWGYQPRLRARPSSRCRGRTLTRTLGAMSESSLTVTWFDPAASAAAAQELSGMEFLSRMVAGEIPQPPMAQRLGFALVSVSDGEGVFEATAHESHYNPIGVIHGGLALTMLDSA